MGLTVWDGITVGAVGGFLAGFTVWFIQLIKERYIEETQKRRVYDWLYAKTKKGKGLTVGSPINDPRWATTEEIACFTNLPKDRIRYLCSIHKKIRPMMESDLFSQQILEEKWGMREFVN
jgi:hypothetical protein